MAKVCVIGAGVIGLSSALAIQEKLPSATITIIADEVSPQLTSDVAAALWMPHLLPETLANRKWITRTFQHLSSLLKTDCQTQCGVTLISVYELFKQHNYKFPWWKDIPYGCRKVSEKELAVFPGHKDGFLYTTVLADTKYYMPWLTQKFVNNGGILIRKNISSFEDLSGQYDIVVNCAGVGSRFIAKDKSVFPIQGQALKVEAPWLKMAVMSIDSSKSYYSYIIPGIDAVTLGASQDKDKWDIKVNPLVSKQIFEDCGELCHSLKDAKILKETVGLRPGRPSVRLEYEYVTTNRKPVHVVHNYGHGGSGYTLHWGCAVEVANLVNRVLLKPRQKAKL